MHSKELLLLALNAVLFNVAWLLCVLGGNQVALTTAVLLVAFHIVFVSGVYQEMFFIAGVTALGYTIDSIIFANKILISPSEYSLAPLWLLALWMCFSTTLNHCFRVLQKRLRLAALLGAIAGTSSYLAGVRLSEVEFGQSITLVGVTFAVIWAILFPLLMSMAGRFRQAFFAEA